MKKSESKIKVADCLIADSIFKLKKAYGELNIEISVAAIISESMDNFNVKMSMTDGQIKFFAEQYVEEYGHETLDDLFVCLKQAAGGKYGEIYNAIDPPLLFGWLRKHLDNKSMERERLQQRNKNANQKQINESPVNQELNKSFCKQIIEELGESKGVKGKTLGDRYKEQQ